VNVDERRIERMENTLDKVCEAVSQIAVVDERIMSLLSRLDRFEKRLDEQEDKIIELSEDVILNSKLVKTSERFFWVGVSALASFIVYMVR
jgi:hypothetical protein